MNQHQLQAAIYVGATWLSPRYRQSTLELSLETCLRYCRSKGYHVSKEHMYLGEIKPFWSDAPSLVHLRTSAFQRRFQVLVIPSPVFVGYITPWETDPAYRTISGCIIPPECSNLAGIVVRDFDTFGVRVESVIPHFGTHNLYAQMFLEVVEMFREMKKNERRKDI